MGRARTTQKRKPSSRRIGRRNRKPKRAPRSAAGALPVFAHDVRTALTGILALGELLAGAELGEREHGWASDIKTSAEYLAALTTLIIDAAKADTGALILRRDVFAPRRLVAALDAALTVRAEAKGLRAAITVADNVPECLTGDPVRLRAALENLLDNAVKFTEHGAVELELHAEPAKAGRVRLHCTVRDSGIGLSRADIKRLFRPFTQAGAEIARRYGGAGLGLSIVKMLAKGMGGDLSVISAPGRGSVFQFTAVLPIASDAAGSAAPPIAPR
jgi:two-component system, sensor histidine kinase